MSRKQHLRLFVSAMLAAIATTLITVGTALADGSGGPPFPR
jgi:hypothetical protein